MKAIVRIDMTDKDEVKCEFISGEVGPSYDNDPQVFIESFQYYFNKWNYGYSWSVDNPAIIMPEITIEDNGSWYWDGVS